MARQTGEFRITGRIGNLDFYISEGEYMARTKTGPSTKQFKTSKAFENSRKASTDFGTAGLMTGRLKRAVYPKALHLLDPKLIPRLTSVFISILQSDHIHDSGERKVLEGDVSKLIGFEFGNKTDLALTLGGIPSVKETDPQQSFEFDFSSINPPVCFPTLTATHFQVVIGLVALPEEGEAVKVWQESGILEAGLPVSDLGKIALSFGSPQSEKLVLGIVSLRPLVPSDDQSFLVLAEGWAMAVVGCFA